MAKISARGDREVARWSGPGGEYAVLTKRGRFLHKLSATDTYKLAGRKLTIGEAEQLAQTRNLTRSR